MSEEPDRGVFQTTEEKVAGWRLEVLTRAYGENTYDTDVFIALEKLAQSRADLWLVQKALRAGCTLELAVAIFT